MKAEVELERLQEALRVRKEKHYQLLERLQRQENIAREAENQSIGLEESLKASRLRLADFETQLCMQENKTNDSEGAYRARKKTSNYCHNDQFSGYNFLKRVATNT